MAKSCGLTVSAKAAFSELHASDFRILAAVISTVLKRGREAIEVDYHRNGSAVPFVRRHLLKDLSY